MKTAPVLPPTADLPDDRITCGTCQRRNGDGSCRVRGYAPVMRLMRCETYLPNIDQRDRRPGNVRWPHLAGPSVEVTTTVQPQQKGKKHG